MKGEKKKILEMIEDGTITASEGLKLLEALERNTDMDIFKESKAKWLKIKVFDVNKNIKAKINLPISIVELGFNIGAKFSNDLKDLKEIDFEEIFKAVKNGTEGKIADIETKDGTRIEIIVE